jgi:protein-L-isoaspartate(D-aspartate) O-methyltransferase
MRARLLRRRTGTWPYRGLILVLVGVAGVVWATTSDTPYAEQRQRMVRDIEAEGLPPGAARGRPALDRRVLDAMRSVPRHAFVPPERQHLAYANRPLAIGYGQTISQPYMVAVMTDLVGVSSTAVVLEIGTGSGYQAAILAELAQHVYSIEIVPELADQARQRLQRLGYTNITVRTGDGYNGWEEHAPFDAIMVTAAASHIPPPLLRQLKPGGRMVIPVGSPFLTQQLMLVSKATDGQITTRQMLPVAFVPLTGKR